MTSSHVFLPEFHLIHYRTLVVKYLGRRHLSDKHITSWCPGQNSLLGIYICINLAFKTFTHAS